MRMSILNTSAPSPDPDSPYVPKWMPSQFKGAKAAMIRKSREYEGISLGETIANAVSNGVGAALAIAALVILIVMAVLHGAGVHLLAALAFGVPMLLAFLMSTLYHALPGDLAKLVFKVLGHDFAFIYIAGAFTPYCVLALNDTLSIAVLGIVWACAFVGVLVESVWLSRPDWLPIVWCAVMCCLSLVLAPGLIGALEPAGWWLLVAAVICFIVGLVVYVRRRKAPYLWFVSHLIVLAGSVCLFLSVVLFVV